MIISLLETTTTVRTVKYYFFIKNKKNNTVLINNLLSCSQKLLFIAFCCIYITTILCETISNKTSFYITGFFFLVILSKYREQLSNDSFGNHEKQRHSEYSGCEATNKTFEAENRQSPKTPVKPFPMLGSS